MCGVQVCVLGESACALDGGLHQYFSMRVVQQNKCMTITLKLIHGSVGLGTP